MQASARLLLLLGPMLMGGTSAFAQNIDLEIAGLRAAEEVQSARDMLERAQESSGDDRQACLEESRLCFETAAEEYESIQAEVRTRLEALPAQPQGNAALQQRDELRDTYLRASLTIPILKFELAETYATDNPQRRATFAEAGELFGDIADKYRRFAAGLVARQWAGRCEYEIGDLDAAMASYEEILLVEGEDPFLRNLRVQTQLYANEIWRDGSVQDFDLIIDRGLQMLESIRPEEQEQRLWLKLRFEVATTCHGEWKSNSTLSEERKAFLHEQFHTQFELVAKSPGEYQRFAQGMLEQLDEAEATSVN